MSNVKVGMSKKGMLIALVVAVLLLGGGGGYLLWRVNQKDTVAPTDSDASSCVKCYKENYPVACTSCGAGYELKDGECCAAGGTGGCTVDPDGYVGNCPYKLTEVNCYNYKCGKYFFKGGNANVRSCGEDVCYEYTLTYTAGTMVNGAFVASTVGGTVNGEGKVEAKYIFHLSSGPEVKAVPKTGYHFKKWDDNGSTNANRQDTSVTKNINAKAIFEKDAVENVTLTYTAGTGGTIDGKATQTIPKGSDAEEVTAKANSGFQFKEWSDGVKTAERTDKNVQANATYTATFTEAAPPPANNNAPTAPTDLYTNGATNPAGIPYSGESPYFSAIFNDPDTGDTATKFELQVNTKNDFATGTMMWNSEVRSIGAVTKGERGSNIVYGYSGSAAKPLVAGTKYYWRIRYYDNHGVQGAWSPHGADAAYFTMAKVSGCGDGVCSADETPESCPIDCGGGGGSICGDGICSADESPATCPADCGGSGGGTVPDTAIFEDTKDTIIFGIVVLMIGIGWTWLSTLPKRAYSNISKASAEIISNTKASRERDTRESRRNRLERKFK